jgi:hypothetical protein
VGRNDQLRKQRLRELIAQLERLPATAERDRMLREVRGRLVDVDTGEAPSLFVADGAEAAPKATPRPAVKRAPRVSEPPRPARPVQVPRTAPARRAPLPTPAPAARRAPAPSPAPAPRREPPRPAPVAAPPSDPPRSEPPPREPVEFVADVLSLDDSPLWPDEVKPGRAPWTRGLRG